MDNSEKFQNKIRCTCNADVFFEIIEDIDCDWGNHNVIQCPKCEELFSIDKKCPAFQNILNLLKDNPELYTKEEQSSYLSGSHPQ